MKEFISCPECNSCISVINGKISRHERGLGYVPYRLYHKISKVTGRSVKDLAKSSICEASGKLALLIIHRKGKGEAV